MTKPSPSLRGRGLKYGDYDKKLMAVEVALFARAWIEIPPFDSVAVAGDSRPLCEGVD